MRKTTASKSSVSEPDPGTLPGEPVDDVAVDYDAILQANLSRVFGERDATRRRAAIAALYAKDAVLHEPDRSVQGHDAIFQAVAGLLDGLPEDFMFRPVGSALGHHALGRLRWTGGPPDGAAIVSGMDVARIEGGLIRSLHVFLEDAGPRE